MVFNRVMESNPGKFPAKVYAYFKKDQFSLLKDIIFFKTVVSILKNFCSHSS
jgi:hypothetical protein